MASASRQTGPATQPPPPCRQDEVEPEGYRSVEEFHGTGGSARGRRRRRRGPGVGGGLPLAAPDVDRWCEPAGAPRATGRERVRRADRVLEPEREEVGGLCAPRRCRRWVRHGGARLHRVGSNESIRFSGVSGTPAMKRRAAHSVSGGPATVRPRAGDDVALAGHCQEPSARPGRRRYGDASLQRLVAPAGREGDGGDGAGQQGDRRRYVVQRRRRRGDGGGAPVAPVATTSRSVAPPHGRTSGQDGT